MFVPAQLDDELHELSTVLQQPYCAVTDFLLTEVLSARVESLEHVIPQPPVALSTNHLDADEVSLQPNLHCRRQRSMAQTVQLRDDVAVRKNEFFPGCDHPIRQIQLEGSAKVKIRRQSLQPVDEFVLPVLELDHKDRRDRHHQNERFDEA